MGYETGQFGKNHLGDLNQFLPTVHGFDEFFGYLYHLDAMEDPFWHPYPPELKDTVGPRNLVHSWATDTDDPTVQPRWGKIGKQSIADEGPLPPQPMPGIKYDMETFDEVIRDQRPTLHRQGEEGRQALLRLDEPDPDARLSRICRQNTRPCARRENGWGLEEAAMTQLDDDRRRVMNNPKNNGLDDNTIVVFTTDNGAESFTWPDGGITPFSGAKGEVTEGGFRVPAMIRWPGKVPAGKVENGIMSGLDWLPTLLAAAGDANIKQELLKGKQIGDRTYKVLLDGYNQIDLITGKGPSNRHEVFYFAQTTLGALRLDDWKYRFIDQPDGWIGAVSRPSMPKMTNLRQDPFERMNWPGRGFAEGSVAYWDSFKHEMWRFQIPLQ